MISQLNKPNRWATRVRSNTSSSSARDLTAIGVNFAQCQACRGRWFSVSCAAEALNRVLAPRLFTLLATAVAVFAAIAVFA